MLTPESSPACRWGVGGDNTPPPNFDLLIPSLQVVFTPSSAFLFGITYVVEHRHLACLGRDAGARCPAAVQTRLKFRKRATHTGNTLG